MKNVKMGGSLKNSIFRGRGRKKAIFRGNCLKRRGLGQFTNLMGALAKKNGVGVVILKCTLCLYLANLLYAIEVDNSTRDKVSSNFN